MSIGLLLNGDVASYFRENADVPGVLWVFQHIPKTAGSSFRTEIARRLRPQANVAVNGMGGRHFSSVQEALDTFLDELPRRKFRFASGHLNRRQIASIETCGRPVRLATMLRKPVDRVISDFRYQRTPKHAGHQKFIAQFPDFESYLESRSSQNRMFEYLRTGSASSADSVIADLEANYTFVGLTEMYPLARHLLFTLLGIEQTPAPESRNRTQASSDNEIPNLDTLRERISRLNADDEAIYSHFLGRYRENREAIVQFLRDRRRRSGD
ncbi:MAG: hypothetical protein ACT4QA_07665 [Panacagrimonas sp.]